MQQKKTLKKPRKLSKTYLENAALHYLGRYASTEAKLAAVLNRKIDRAAKFHGQDPEEFYPYVRELVARYVQVGLLDDAAFARNRLDSLRRSGGSARAISVKLRNKGVPKEIIATLLNAESEAENDSEESAARAFARKKKLGVYRQKSAADPRKEDMKDMAKMARGGFSYDTIRRVLNVKNDEESI